MPRDEKEQQPSPPTFGHEEAEAVADAQDEAVEQGLLPPSQDEAEPGTGQRRDS